MNKLVAILCALLCVFQGVGSVETEHTVEDFSSIKQPSSALGVKSNAVDGDDISTAASISEVENKGVCTIANRLEPGFARKGEAFRETSAPDATYCALMCATTVTGCIAINYGDSDRTCFFLKDPGYIYVSPGYTTALVNPSLNNVCSADNVILGYARYGGDMSGNPYNAVSAMKCCLLCYVTPGCIAYGFALIGGNCWLKNVITSLTKHDEVMSGLVCLD